MSKKEDVEFVLPSSPEDRKKIKEAIHEIVGALQFIDDKKAFIKDVVTMLKDNFEMPKKISTKMAKTLFKQDYQDVIQDSSMFEVIYENLFEVESKE